jgi:hypothetical protein
VLPPPTARKLGPKITCHGVLTRHRDALTRHPRAVIEGSRPSWVRGGVLQPGPARARTSGTSAASALTRANARSGSGAPQHRHRGRASAVRPGPHRRTAAAPPVASGRPSPRH